MMEPHLPKLLNKLFFELVLVKSFPACIYSSFIQIFRGVAIEPSLQPITSERLRGSTANTQDGARMDIVASGFWGGTFERAFFDISVFNPLAPSKRHPSITTIYRQHESLKKRHYKQRIRDIEHSSFSPLVFSLTGGMGPTASVFYKRLASLLAEKWDQPYSSTIGWLRCRLTFSLLRSSIMCIRGARSSTNNFDTQLAASVDLAIKEAKLSVYIICPIVSSLLLNMLLVAYFCGSVVSCIFLRFYLI